MASRDDDTTDEASIKPVSSLRNLFEHKSVSQDIHLTRRSPSVSPHVPSPRAISVSEDSGAEQSRLDGRFSLDIPRESTRRASPARNDEQSQRLVGSRRKAPDPPPPRSSSTPRPLSMGPLSPPRSPPMVKVESPKSPPNTLDRRPISPLTLIESGTGQERRQTPRDRSTATAELHLKQRARTESPSSRTQANLLTRFNPSYVNNPESEKIAAQPGLPPPVNRAGKPKLFSKALDVKRGADSLAPNKSLEKTDEKASPFSTPPSSDPSSPDLEPSARPLAHGVKARPHEPKDGCGEPHGMNLRPRFPDVLPPPKSAFTPQQSTGHTSNKPAFHQSDLPRDRPELPRRREKTPERTPRRGHTADVANDLPLRRLAENSHTTGRVLDGLGSMPPPKRAPTGTMDGEDRRHGATASSHPRASSDMKRVLQDERRGYTSESDLEPGSTGTYTASKTSADYPDSSHSNRRPPRFRHPPYDIPTKYDTKLFAIAGEYLCTSGYLTRAWNVTTGDILMTLSHGETVKMTSLAFKPVPNAEDDGKRVWLGSNSGDIHEVDIPSQSIVATRSNAHPRREIIRIYRHASNMWTLDEDGKIMIWTPDADGSPSLSMTPRPFNLGRGHTFSVLAGNNLWFAAGKEISVWYYDSKSENVSQVTPRPLTPPGCGEITSGSIIPGQNDRLYFGHVDGKISIYSRLDYSCLGIVNVSLYRISALAGVGDYLWAGYNTGKVYVYDTSSRPWKVRKDWNAHGDRIAGIVLDRSSLWKLDRLQVASLGTDNCVKIWDGMLREDCLEEDMQSHDVDFCEFREVSATVMTWNAGAAKPTWLRQDDANVFRELLTANGETPSILVFGFQELVDLEKKSLTAKNLFKRSKKKDVLVDGSVQEHMSHQYRMWRDHLSREIALHVKEPYVLLHSASLIGLFSCVFVKASERQNIRDVSAAEIKLGMGGHYGNKGALVVRLVLDDSSLCFVNCHLAAGQTQTASRNNDVATIMESNNLPQKISSTNAGRSDIFVGGGDGRMILDHEICILNGDLNYRIDTIPRDQVIIAAKQGNFAKLLERDQLLLSRKRNPGFRLRAFTESPLTFAPTYKYDVGTDNYDSSEKKRSPAWCDRILYRGYGSVRQLEYRRHEVRVSDHRPVSAAFKLRVKTIDPDRRRDAWEASEERFEVVKRRIAMDIKLDYLINILGCSDREAQRLLAKK